MGKMMAKEGGEGGGVGCVGGVVRREESKEGQSFSFQLSPLKRTVPE